MLLVRGLSFGLASVRLPDERAAAMVSLPRFPSRPHAPSCTCARGQASCYPEFFAPKKSRACPVGLLVRGGLSVDDRAFSDIKPNGEALERRRSGRPTRLVRVLAAAVFMMTAGFAGFAGYRWFEAARELTTAEQRHNEAEQQRNEAANRMLAAMANQAVSAGAAGTAMLLALEALPDAHAGMDRVYTPQAEAALFAAAARLQEIAVFKGHGDYVVYAEFSPDGRRVVTASWDMTARIWDAETHQQIGVLVGHEGSLYTAAFSPDGRHIITSGRDKTARI